MRMPDPIPALELALQIARAHGDQHEEAFCLRYLGLNRSHWFGDDTSTIPQGIAQLEESLALYRVLGDRFSEAHVLDEIGYPLVLIRGI